MTLDRAGSPSVVRRMLGVLARTGIDLRPPLRRMRDAILRPVRHELATDTAALRGQFDARIAAEASSRDSLHAHIAELSSRINAEVDRRRTTQAQLADTQAQLADTRAQLADTRARLADTRARLVTEARLAEASARIDTQNREWRTRIETLERLMTEAERAISPSAAQWLREIPSPVVSVILPTRDRARFVSDAIESVQAQHFTDWELIIVDDGSADDTAAIVEPYLEDRRIRYLQRPAQGVSAARNRGLEHARGAFVAYLDSDNIWYPGFLAAAVPVFASEPDLAMIYGVLVTDSHHLDGTQLLWTPFDRERLLSANYIDINVVVHRKILIDRYGGFDETLGRLNDWDLVLRFTEHVPARPVPVLAARYRICDDLRVTTTRPFGPELFTIKRKWFRPASAARPRVLYAMWQYPQLSETYIEGEIRCMLRFGADVEVWREAKPATPHPTLVPIHEGPLPDVVRRVRPDVIHVHWLSSLTRYAPILAQLGTPVTARLHGFDTSPDACRAILDQPWMRAVYAFPHHLDLIGRSDPGLRAVPAAFDSTLFRPCASKDRRLVLRAGAALPSKDHAFFFELANRLPDYRFVLAAITCSLEENFAAAYRDLHQQMKSRCELMFDIQHEDLAPLIAQAGIYLHTVKPPGTEHGTPIGMPISIAEAMATGAYILVRDLPELRDYVGDAGTTYRDAEDAAEIIAATAEWPEQKWKAAWTASVDRAFSVHADEIALRPMFDDWCSAVQERSHPP